mgnify:CR=1 FL=1
MKYLSQGHKSPNIALDKPPDSSTTASGKHNSNHQNKNSAKSKHERDRPRSKPAIYQNETEGSSEDLLDEDDEEAVEKHYNQAIYQVVEDPLLTVIINRYGSACNSYVFVRWT